jgi:hypothetical protein
MLGRGGGRGWGCGWGGGGYKHIYFSTRWKLVVSFTPFPFQSRDRNFVTHVVVGWSGLKADLHAMVKRKFLTLQGFELRTLCQIYGKYSHLVFDMAFMLTQLRWNANI